MDVAAAEPAIVRTIAAPLGLTALEAAEGIYRLVNANMAAALRVASVERGHDPREFALIVAGGAGPLHAGMLARELDVPLGRHPPAVVGVLCGRHAALGLATR